MLLLAPGASAFSIPTPFQMPNIENIFGTGGGRAPGVPNKIDSEETWEPTPAVGSEARLIVIQITDCYTLEHYGSLRTLIQDVKEKSGGAKVCSMLTGDFLSPYLLSGVDNGAGMMNALAKTPIDILTWGNHGKSVEIGWSDVVGKLSSHSSAEADIDHDIVCRYVRNWEGKWINSNMLDHDEMEHQQEYDVIEIDSPDGSNSRKVGLCAVLSDDPALYSHFKEPGAFGGATITDPWEALTKYKDILENQEGCDMVLPLQHLYVPDDHRTCREFDFPVILSGHDHHRVDEVVEGTRLLKPGMNAEFATVLEISWPNGKAEKPSIRSRFVNVDDWEADPVLEEENERAYDVLLPLRNTELARVPPNFEPLTSNGSRDSVCTMGKFICSLLKSSLNTSRKLRKHEIDCVALMGGKCFFSTLLIAWEKDKKDMLLTPTFPLLSSGNIRGNTDYPLGSFFSMEALEQEVKSDEVISTVLMPGWLLAKGIEETHAGEPISGWMQYDEGVQEEIVNGKPKVTHIGGKPLDENRIYRVATKISDLTNGQSPAWTEYFSNNPHLLPPKGKYVNINSELMGHFARNLWQRLWAEISREIGEKPCGLDGGEVPCDAEERLAVLDRDGTGYVTVADIKYALKDKLGFSIDKREDTLAKFVHSYADQSGNGRVTKKDFEILCEQFMERECATSVAEEENEYLSAGKMGLVATLDEQTNDDSLMNHRRVEVVDTESDEPIFPSISDLVAHAILGSAAKSSSDKVGPKP